MGDIQAAAFVMFIISHGMTLLSGNQIAEESDLSAWFLLIAAIVLALTAFSLVTP